MPSCEISLGEPFFHFGYTYSLVHSRSSFTRKFLAWCYPLGAVHPPPTLPATLLYSYIVVCTCSSLLRAFLLFFFFPTVIHLKSLLRIEYVDDQSIDGHSSHLSLSNLHRVEGEQEAAIRTHWRPTKYRIALSVRI